MRRHVGDNHVVHVAAVVHHEDDAGAGLDAGERLVVRITEAHAVEAFHRPSREVIADAKVGVGVEGGHDLPGVALHLPAQHLARDAGGLGLGLDRLHHVRVVGELVDQHPALSLLKRRDLQLEPGVHLLDHAVESAAQEPARARHEDPVQRGPERERAHHAQDPERQREGAGHARAGRPARRAASERGGLPAQGWSRPRIVTGRLAAVAQMRYL